MSPSATPVMQMATVPDINGMFGSPITFAARAELESYGFAWGPSNGQSGSIPAGGNTYIPATSDTPDLSGTGGKYTPRWSKDIGGAEVVYDRNFEVYLAFYQSNTGIKVRASSDLIHWSDLIAAPYNKTERTLYYPTLIGETGDPTVAGVTPRIYFSSFPAGHFRVANGGLRKRSTSFVTRSLS